MYPVQFTVNPTTNLHVNISHFIAIDQEIKQVAMEEIQTRINNPSTQSKMYILEIFNTLLGIDRPSDRSVQMADLDLPQGHTHLTIPSNRFSRAVYLAN